MDNSELERLQQEALTVYNRSFTPDAGVYLMAVGLLEIARRMIDAPALRKSMQSARQEKVEREYCYICDSSADEYCVECRRYICPEHAVRIHPVNESSALYCVECGGIESE